jgi:hypothetical protein
MRPSTVWALPILLLLLLNGSASELVYRVQIPTDWGEVKQRWQSQDRFKKQNSPFIIYLQDAHLSREVQENQSQIIQWLVKKYDIKLVAVEGAEGPLEINSFRRFPDSKIKNKVSSYFIRTSLFTGAMKAAIMSDNPIDFFGAENGRTYLENDQVMRYSFEAREKAIKKIKQWNADLEKYKQTIYSKDLFELDQLQEQFRTEKIGFLEYYLKLYRLSSVLDLTQHAEFAYFAEVVNNYVEEKNLSRLSSFDWSSLFIETKRVQDDLENYLAQDEKSAQLVRASQCLNQILDLIELKAQPDQVDYFYANEDDFLQSLSFGLPINISHQDFKDLIHILKEVKAFYNLADLRSMQLVENTLDEMNDKGLNVAILVAGGYHTPGIVKTLRQNRLPHIVIAPRLTQMNEEINSPYFFQEFHHPLAMSRGLNTLAFVNLFSHEPLVLNASFRGQELLLQAKNAVEANLVAYGLVEALKNKTPQDYESVIGDYFERLEKNNFLTFQERDELHQRAKMILQQAHWNQLTPPEVASQLLDSSR